MSTEQAKEYATLITGRTPLRCDVKNIGTGEFQQTQPNENTSDCVAITARGEETYIGYYVNSRPIASTAAAICYF